MYLWIGEEMWPLPNIPGIKSFGHLSTTPDSAIGRLARSFHCRGQLAHFELS